MTFTIKPRPKGDGYTLESEALSGPMWYGEVGFAASYARARAGAKRARIEVYDEIGKLIETIEHDPARASQRLGEI